MTSKEALQQIMTIYGETNSLEGTYVLFLKIKQDLERLEALEQKDKKWQELFGRDLCEALGREILLQENEKLKKALEILIREKIKPSAFLGILKDYKYHNKVDIPYEKVSIYLDCKLTQQEYELLKEVLE